jgi:hypothetical protein
MEGIGSPVRCIRITDTAEGIGRLKVVTDTPEARGLSDWKPQLAYCAQAANSIYLFFLAPSAYVLSR